MTEDKKPRFFYGYVVLVAAVSIQLIAWGLYNSFGVFFNPLLTEFGWPRATISGAASLSQLLIGLGAIALGGLSDRFGPRKVMATGGAILGLGYLLMSRVNAIWQLYLFYGVIVGIGVSGTDVVLLSMIARWFVKKRGMMSGIVKIGTGIGIMTVPLVAGGLIATQGWRNTYLIVGAAALVLIVLATQFLRRDPGEMRQLPYGDEEVSADGVNSVETGLSLREAVHTNQFWMLCAVYLTVFFCANTVMVHIAPHAVDLGMSVTAAASIISLIGGASIIGRFMMGSAGDKIGNKLAVTICFAILLVALLWLQVASELWMLFLFAVIYGFAHGGFFALMSPIVAGLFGTSSQGIILGIIIFGGSIGGAIGPIVAGRIFDITQSYQTGFWILAAFSVIGLTLTMSLRPIIGKGGGK